MKTVILAILLTISLIPVAKMQEELSAGKELSILLDETITEYRSTIEIFIFEQKVLGEESQKDKIMIVEQKIDELATVMNYVDSERVHLMQQLHHGRVTEEEFTVEMKKLAAEVTSLVYVMDVLGETLSEMAAALSGELQERVRVLVEEFNSMAATLSEISTALSHEIRKRGHESNIPHVSGIAGSSEKGSSEKGSSEKGSSEKGSSEKGSSEQGPPESPGPPKPPGHP
jgi:hypothetical protein